MEITNPVLFEVLLEKRRAPAPGASAADPKRRPFPWVGTGAPATPSPTTPALGEAAGERPALGEVLGLSATLLAIALAALV